MQTASSTSHRRVTRRDFLGHTATLAALAAFPTIIPATALGRNGKVAPSNRITLAGIGTGERGLGVLQGFLSKPDCQVVAVCDVKSGQRDKARKAVNAHYKTEDCRGYPDFRDLLARKDIDACLVASPDHWHALHAVAAVNSGKDVYVEKPLALSMEERAALRKALQRRERVFQFGTQQRSGRMFRLASEMVRNEAIGKLQHIVVWAPASSIGGSRKVVPPMDGLDFNTWLGPAPVRPYTENLCGEKLTEKTWWFVSDFALGFIAGWGIHPLDIALWGAGPLMDGTFTVEGRGCFRPALGICDTATLWDIDFTFASGLTLKFAATPNGGSKEAGTREPDLYQDAWKQRYRRIDGHGTAFEGSGGWVHVDRERINLQPEDLIDLDPDRFQTRLHRSSDHARDFLDSVKSRQETVSPIGEAIRGDNLCHVADIALRLGRKLTFDQKKERFVNDDTADAMFQSRPMRKPWTLRSVG